MKPILAKIHNTQHDKRMTLPSQPVLPIILEIFFCIVYVPTNTSLEHKGIPKPISMVCKFIAQLRLGERVHPKKKKN